MAMPYPYDSWCGGYDIINGRDARSNFAYMWGDIHFADGEGIYWGTGDDVFVYDDGTRLIFDMGTHYIQVWDGGDLEFYSDGGVTLELTIDGATGNIIGTATNLIFTAAGYIALVPTTVVILGDGGVTNYITVDNAGYMSFTGAAAIDSDLPFETQLTAWTITTTGGQDFGIRPLDAGGAAADAYFHYDASTDRWGFGTAAPAVEFDIQATCRVYVTDANAFQVQSGGGTCYFKVDSSTPEVELQNSVDLVVYSDAGVTTELTIDGATGNILPGTAGDPSLGATGDGWGDIWIHNGSAILSDTVGGADLGSAANEWGDIYLAADSTILFGSGQEVTVGYITAETALVLDTGGVPTEIWDGGDLVFYSDGGTVTTLTIDGATGDILPGTVGSADLGSATLEWGDIFIADNKGVVFGTDSDVKLYESGTALVFDMGAHELNIWDGQLTRSFVGAGVTEAWGLRGAGGGADLMGVGGAGAGDVQINLHGFSHQQMWTVDLLCQAEEVQGELVDVDPGVNDGVTTGAINSTAIVGVITQNPHPAGTNGPICTVNGSVVDIKMNGACNAGNYVETGGVGGDGYGVAPMPPAGRCCGLVIETIGAGGLARCIFYRM